MHPKGCGTFYATYIIDADEIVTAELQQELQKITEQKVLPAVAFNIPRSLIFMQHKLRFGGEYRNLQLRFFDRQAANFNNLTVHETVIVEKGKILNLKNEILHYSYRNIEDYFNKLNSYTSLAAQKLYNDKKKTNLTILILRFPFDFCYKYLLRGLIFDGFAGFIWALFSTIYPIVKYTKLEEMWRMTQKNKNQID